MKNFDIVIIGAGPAGLAAAYKLKTKFNQIAVVEDDLWGGTCPNRGCDPKKVFLSAVEARDKINNFQGKGFNSVPTINWPELETFKATFTDPVSAGSRAGIVAAGITAIDGYPEFISRNQIEVNDQLIQADKFIIATGQRPSILNVDGNENLLTSTDFLSLKQLPETVTFIGAGYIAFELATIANAAGAKVHIVHHNDHPLKHFETEFVKNLVEQLEAKGVEFHFNVDTKSIQKVDDKLVLQADDFQLSSDLIFGATGRIANVDDLGLEKAGVEYSLGGINVNTSFQSTNENIYAIGDVVAKDQPKLTPVAGFEADFVAEELLSGQNQTIVYPAVPTLVYGTPQIAKVGVSVEAAAKSEQYQVQALDMTQWFTYRKTNQSVVKAKIVLNNNQQIVGATVISEEAEQLINLLTMAINRHYTHQDVVQTIFAYPTVASDLEYLI